MKFRTECVLRVKNVRLMMLIAWHCCAHWSAATAHWICSRDQLKCDDTRAETRFRLSAKRTSPFKSAGDVSSVDYWQSDVCASAVVMLDTPCSEVAWKVLATHSIRQSPLHSSPVHHRVPSHFNWPLTGPVTAWCLNAPYVHRYGGLSVCFSNELPGVT